MWRKQKLGPQLAGVLDAKAESSWRLDTPGQGASYRGSRGELISGHEGTTIPSFQNSLKSCQLLRFVPLHT